MSRNLRLIVILLLLLLSFSEEGWCTNIKIASPSVGTLSGGSTTVTFNVTWEHSWRNLSAIGNWDAAWVFVKFRKNGGNWTHASLNSTGHSMPSGAMSSNGVVDTSSAFNIATNPVVGVFIYRSADGSGTFTANNVSLSWNYSQDGVTGSDTVEVRVFAIEMVYIPDGSFFAGDNASSTLAFKQGSSDSDPWWIGSEDAITTGGLMVNYIAKREVSLWSSLGKGMNNSVWAVTLDSSGNLYAGGRFTTAGGVTTNYIAKWNGTSWSSLGTGMDGDVYALTFDSSGNLYAGGLFSTAGGTAVNNIAKWNGTSWSDVGGGTDGTVQSLATYSSNILYVGGGFSTAGGTTVNNIAKWNGSSWSSLGTGTNDAVTGLAVSSSGDLYAGGYFTIAGGTTVNYIAQWNGTSWSGLDTGMDNWVQDIALDSSNNLYAGGIFSTAGGVSTGVAKWNGTSWSGISGSPSAIEAISFDSSGNLYVGGAFSTAGGVTVNNIAKWNGTSWSSLGTGASDVVRDIAIDSGSNPYVGGDFLTVQSDGTGTGLAETALEYYYPGSGDAAGSRFTIPAAYPKGYQKFYMMKGEISQGQWVAFFNTLTSNQKSTRDITRSAVKNSDGLVKRNNVSWIGGSTDATLPDQGGGATYEGVAMNYLSWDDLAAYLDWAGLRPMSELEFERAGRGPYRAVSGEYAWGSTSITYATTISNGGTSTEAAQSGANCVGNNSANVQGPMRVGAMSYGKTTRIASGAGYYGNMDLSCNLRERAVTVGDSTGRSFEGRYHGNGALTTSGTQGNANVSTWPGTTGIGLRGGVWSTSTVGQLSWRNDAAFNAAASTIIGGRGVRTAP